MNLQHWLIFQQYLSLLIRYTWFTWKQVKLSDECRSLVLLDLAIPATSPTQWKIFFLVTPTPRCVESDVFDDLLAEPTSAYSQTREDGRTSPLISPLSCLFSFSFLSISPLSLSLHPSLYSFVLSCPPSACGCLLPRLSHVLFSWVKY